MEHGLLDVLRDCCLQAVGTLPSSSPNDASTFKAILADTLRGSLGSAVRTIAHAWIPRHDEEARLLRLSDQNIRQIMFYGALCERLALSKTSSRLRTIALATPDLWRTVAIGSMYGATYRLGDRAPERTNWKGALAVAKRSVLTAPTFMSVFNLAQLISSTDDADSLSDMLATAGRLHLDPYFWRTWDIHTRNPGAEYSRFEIMFPPPRSLWLPLTELLTRPAPNIRSFKLRFPVETPVYPQPVSERLSIDPNLFSGEVGQLSECHLIGFTLPSQGCPSFSALTLFDYHPVPSTLSASDIVSILTWMPQLETLGLVTIPVSFSAAERDRVSLHRHLRKVAIVLVHPVVADGLTADTNYLDIVALFRAYTSNASIIADVRKLWRDMSRWWGDLDAHNFSIYQVDAYDEIGILRSGNIMLLMQVYPLLDEMIAGTAVLFTSLTRFTICELHWPDTGFPSAPNLRELSIILYTCSWWSDNLGGGEVSSIFLSSESWDCPSLSALSIIAPPPPDSCPLQYLRHTNSSCACSNGGIISLESVCAFVRVLRGLRYNAPRLHSLTLSGIQAQADVDPVTAFLRVQDIADEIIFCGTPPRDLEMLETLVSTLFEVNHTATQLFDTSVQPLPRGTIDYLSILR